MWNRIATQYIFWRYGLLDWATRHVPNVYEKVTSEIPSALKVKLADIWEYQRVDYLKTVDVSVLACSENKNRTYLRTKIP